MYIIETLIASHVVMIKFVICWQLIQFLVSVVGNQKHQLNTGLKRKAPLMLGQAPPIKMTCDRSDEKVYPVQAVW